MKKTPPILSVENVRIERDGTVILRDVNWRVRRGEHWVILGANGSGKTSLLNALAGYLMPSSGEISVLGRTYGRADWRELRKQLGLVSSSIRPEASRITALTVPSSIGNPEGPNTVACRNTFSFRRGDSGL